MPWPRALDAWILQAAAPLQDPHSRGSWTTANPAAAEPKPPKVKQKNDPKLVAAARELRDRWLEEVNGGRHLPAAEGKYAVERQLPVSPVKLIAA